MRYPRPPAWPGSANHPPGPPPAAMPRRPGFRTMPPPPDTEVRSARPRPPATLIAASIMAGALAVLLLGPVVVDFFVSYPEYVESAGHESAYDEEVAISWAQLFGGALIPLGLAVPAALVPRGGQAARVTLTAVLALLAGITTGLMTESDPASDPLEYAIFLALAISSLTTVVLLYWPTSNAFVKEMRHFRR